MFTRAASNKLSMMNIYTKNQAENIFNKNYNQNSIIGTIKIKYLTLKIKNSDQYYEEEDKKTNKNHNYYTRSNREDNKINEMEVDDDEKFANNEYTKFVVKALKEAIDENEQVKYINTIF